MPTDEAGERALSVPEYRQETPDFGRGFLAGYAAAQAEAAPTDGAGAGNYFRGFPVKDFGAKGDGVTDDSAAIQRAVNYAARFMALVRERDAAQAEAARLREALAFYAEADHYDAHLERGNGLADVVLDEGERARTALEADTAHETGDDGC